jgi:hypothetical protein
VKPTTHLHLVPRSFPNTPSWRGVQLKHRDNFTFTFIVHSNRFVCERVQKSLRAGKIRKIAKIGYGTASECVYFLYYRLCRWGVSGVCRLKNVGSRFTVDSSETSPLPQETDCGYSPGYKYLRRDISY